MKNEKKEIHINLPKSIKARFYHYKISNGFKNNDEAILDILNKFFKDLKGG